MSAGKSSDWVRHSAPLLRLRLCANVRASSKERYPAPEKLEIIRLVEQSHLPVRRTLAQIGVPPATFYRWYDLYQPGGPEALENCSPRTGRVRNRIPDL